MMNFYDLLIRILIMILPVFGFMVEIKIDEWYGTLINITILCATSMLIGFYGRNYDKFFKN